MMKFYWHLSLVLVFFSCFKGCQKPVNNDLTRSTAQVSFSIREDKKNDVVDKSGKISRSEFKGIDLVKTTLEKITPEELKVTFESSENIDRSIFSEKSALWQVEIWNYEGVPIYQLSVHLVGTQWKAFIFNRNTLVKTYVENPTIIENKITVNYPVDKLPGLPISIKWSASSEFDENWSDKLPENGSKVSVDLVYMKFFVS